MFMFILSLSQDAASDCAIFLIKNILYIYIYITVFPSSPSFWSLFDMVLMSVIWDIISLRIIWFKVF